MGRTDVDRTEINEVDQIVVAEVVGPDTTTLIILIPTTNRIAECHPPAEITIIADRTDHRIIATTTVEARTVALHHLTLVNRPPRGIEVLSMVDDMVEEEVIRDGVTLCDEMTIVGIIENDDGTTTKRTKWMTWKNDLLF